MPHPLKLYGLARVNGVAACRPDCAGAADTFIARVADGASRPLYWGGLAVMVLLPALLGAFWACR